VTQYICIDNYLDPASLPDVKASPRSSQLQIRVSAAQKAAIRGQARRAGLGMSEWVLSRVLPPAAETFQRLLRELSRAERPGLVLAAIHDLLAPLTAEELARAVSESPRVTLTPYWASYVAATVEVAAARVRSEAPAWTDEVPPLAEPVFGSSLESLRLHLLTRAPVPFRRRNIFIDSSIGDRV
jgi:hypothetical protein